MRKVLKNELDVSDKKKENFKQVFALISPNKVSIKITSMKPMDTSRYTINIQSFVKYTINIQSFVTTSFWSLSLLPTFINF